MDPLEIANTPEYKRLQLVKGFEESIKVFQGNYDEMLEDLRRYSQDEHVQIWSINKRDNLDDFLSLIIRRLHNFVASASSLIDHARAFHKTNYEQNGLFPDYQTQVNVRFVNDPLSRFIVELRQFCLHRRHPSINASMNFDGLCIRKDQRLGLQCSFWAVDLPQARM